MDPQFPAGAPQAPVQLIPYTSAMAIWSMILGLASIPLIFICLGFVTAPLAIIFGFIGMSKMKGVTHIKGKAFALIGVITGIGPSLI